MSYKVIFMMILQGAVVVIFCSWYVQLSSFQSALPESKVHVLLLSTWRSGSSFLGQVFNQHPSVFYLMEPAFHVWDKGEKPSARQLRMAVRDLLRSLFQCDFSVMDSYLPENPRVSSLFQWTQSQALCSPPACSLLATNETQCLNTCDARGLEKVEMACHKHSHVVLKETRLFELGSLYPLLQDPKLDLRIVHLIRDPRAVLRSREESASGLKRGSDVVLQHKDIPAADMQCQVMQEVCRGHMQIYETATKNPPLFLEGRYKMVRYEDVARNPLKEVGDIYEFVNLEMTDEIQEWIVRMTHGARKGSRQDAFKIISRNASAVSQAWRTMLPHHKVKCVQDVCKEAFSLFGYNTVDSEQEQKALDLDLIMPLEPAKFRHR